MENSELHDAHVSKTNDIMIAGCDGPFVFPFEKVEGDYITVRRSRLEHHNSQIAIFVADKNSLKVSVRPRDDLSISTPKADGVAKEQDEQFDNRSTGFRRWQLEDPSPPEREQPLPTKEESARRLGSERKVDQYSKRRPISEEVVVKSEAVVFYPQTQSRQNQNKEPRGERQRREFDSQLRRAQGAWGSSSSDEEKVTKGLHIPKTSVKAYFQWQFEKLAQEMYDEENNAPSDASVYSGQQSKDTLSDVGEEALQFYQKARTTGDEEYADKFLLLVGRCIQSLSTNPKFLSLDVNELCQILRSDYFGVSRERQVWRAAFSWVNYDEANRKEDTAQVMGCIRYGLMSKKEMMKCLASHPELKDHLRKVPPYQKSVLDGCLYSYARETGHQSLQNEFRQLPRHCYKQYYKPTSVRRPGMRPPGFGAGRVSSIILNKEGEMEKIPTVRRPTDLGATGPRWVTNQMIKRDGANNHFLVLESQLDVRAQKSFLNH